MKTTLFSLILMLISTSSQASVWCNSNILNGDPAVYIQNEKTVEVVVFGANEGHLKAALDECIKTITHSQCRADYASETPASEQLDDCKIKEAFAATQAIKTNGPTKEPANPNPSVLDFTK